MDRSSMMAFADKKFWEDARWASENIRKLDGFPDQWVAIADKAPVAHGKDHGSVEEEARKKTGRENIYMIYVECDAPIISV